jgi:hypothetical protein
MTDKETYLGDGLYASFDGWQIKLRAPHGYVDQEVYLEPEVLVRFESFVAEVRAAIKSANGIEQR